MSTDSHSDTSHASSRGPFALHSNRSDGNEGSDQVNQELIQETRNQIRKLVDEIGQLSESGCDKLEFYEGFLTRCTQALASIGGAIWELNDGNLSLEYQINLGRTNLTEETTRTEHDRLIGRLVSAGEAKLIPPHSGTDEKNSLGNPTEHLLVVAPLEVNQKVVGVVEIFQRPDSGPTTQRGYLRFLNQMCSQANNFLSRNQLRQYDDRQQMWQQLDQFVRNVHKDLNVNQSIYAIANEGRRVIGSDRVSVALKQGSQYTIKSVSGLDSIERRAEQVKKLSRLTRAVGRTNESLWYSGEADQLAPQIETLLHDYVDLSHSKVVGIIPLRKSTNETPDNEQDRSRTTDKPGPIIGALIVEQLSEDGLSTSLTKRSEAVAEHGGLALSNSIAHNSILFASLWQRLGQMSAIVKLRNLPKTLLVVGILACAIATLCLVPYPFTLGSNGKLIPETTYEVFARADGTLMEINVPENPDEIVQPNQQLAGMVDNKLLVEIQNLQGQLKQTIERIAKYHHLQAIEPDHADALRTESELDEAKEAKYSLERQLEIKMRQLAFMKITAPAAGRVVNWKLRENLLRRPVLRGQNLMTIVDPNTEWLVELELPERRTMHLMSAIREQTSDEPLQVTFTLASHPGKQFSGRLADVDRRLDVHSENGNTLKIRVAFDKSKLPEELLRDGTRVTAKIEVGTRSLGYVWLHELFETVQSSVVFWF